MTWPVTLSVPCGHAHFSGMTEFPENAVSEWGSNQAVLRRVTETPLPFAVDSDVTRMLERNFRYGQPRIIPPAAQGAYQAREGMDS